MKEWFALSEDLRKEIFAQISVREGLPQAAIEKDHWVTIALRIIFSLPVGEHLVFKGGTSLSKGWNLIERFSEDVDLAIDRKFLGFGNELSKTQVKKLRRASYSFISNDMKDAMVARIEELEIPDISLSVQDMKDPDTDPLVIEMQYTSLTETLDYLRPRVLIEIGARSLMEPNSKMEIRSMVDSHFADKDFANEPILIPTVLPKRTFLEKAFLLHEEFQRPIERIRVERFTRHLYDLDRLMATQHGEDALNDPELYRSIVLHRQLFNRLKGVDYSRHHPHRIDFCPPTEILEKWGKDYRTMQGSMIYGESKRFSELIESVRAIQEQFRAMKPMNLGI